jgi:hypothetical protein
MQWLVIPKVTGPKNKTLEEVGQCDEDESVSTGKERKGQKKKQKERKGQEKKPKSMAFAERPERRRAAIEAIDYCVAATYDEAQKKFKFESETKEIAPQDLDVVVSRVPYNVVAVSAPGSGTADGFNNGVVWSREVERDNTATGVKENQASGTEQVKDETADLEGGSKNSLVGNVQAIGGIPWEEQYAYYVTGAFQPKMLLDKNFYKGSLVEEVEKVIRNMNYCEKRKITIVMVFMKRPEVVKEWNLVKEDVIIYRAGEKFGDWKVPEHTEIVMLWGKATQRLVSAPIYDFLCELDVPPKEPEKKGPGNPAG